MTRRQIRGELDKALNERVRLADEGVINPFDVIDWLENLRKGIMVDGRFFLRQLDNKL
jgi:hypothetical protein